MNHPIDRPSLYHFAYCPEYYEAGMERDQGFFRDRRADRVLIGHDVWIGHKVTVLHLELTATHDRSRTETVADGGFQDGMTTEDAGRINVGGTGPTTANVGLICACNSRLALIGRAADLVRLPEGLRVSIRSSKTDQVGAGHVIATCADPTSGRCGLCKIGWMPPALRMDQYSAGSPGTVE